MKAPYNLKERITESISSMPALILKALVVLSLLYLLLAAYALLVSDSMIFHPEYSRDPDPPGAFKIGCADGALISALHLENETARFILLFSYGNASSLGNCYPFLQWLRELGFSIFAYDYSGYGSSQGRPSERALYRDIDAAYGYLTDSLKVPPERIIAFGQSLGGAAAVDLASRRRLGGLIVESSFVSAFRVMTKIPLLPFDKFNSIRKIGRVTCPVLVIHGDSDRTIPLWHGQALFRAARSPKKLLVVPGGDHNYVPEEYSEDYEKALRGFAASIK
jgi:hypothetical protein